METKLTYSQWRANLWMYVGGTALLSISSGIISVDFDSIKHVIAFFSGVIGTGLITAKAYTGRATEVEDKIETESKTTMSTGPM
jgi:hypothetical protein